MPENYKDLYEINFALRKVKCPSCRNYTLIASRSLLGASIIISCEYCNYSPNEEELKEINEIIKKEIQKRKIERSILGSTTPETLCTHERLIKVKEKIYKCEECGKIFSF